MPKYEIEWTEEYWFRVKIEANTEQEAMDKWSNGDYNQELDPYGVDIQDGVDIRLIEEENN